MKCEHVQAIAVEYTEGALGVADELCVDIHLVQCESCRAELGGIAQWEASVVGELDTGFDPPRTVELLDRLDALMQLQQPDPRTTWRQAGGVTLRAAIFAVILIFALSSGAATWQRESAGLLGLIPAEAATHRPIVETVRPLAGPAELDELRYLNELAGPADPSPER